MKRLLVFLLAALTGAGAAHAGCVLEQTPGADMNVVIPVFQDSNGTNAGDLATGLTIAAGEVYLSKNGAAYAAKNDAGACTEDTAIPGHYRCPLDSANDLDTAGTLAVVIEDGAGTSSEVPIYCQVLASNAFDSLYGADTLQAHVVEYTSGVITAAAIATNAIGNDEFNVTETLTANPAAGGIGDAALAGNLEVVFVTDFAANYDDTADSWFARLDSNVAHGGGTTTTLEINNSGGSGDAISATGGTNGDGMILTGTGSAYGLNVQSGTGLTSHGFYAKSNASGLGHGAHFTSDTLSGLYAVSLGSSTGSGAEFVGGGSGHGIKAQAGTTGNGLDLEGGGTSGDAVELSVTSGSNIDYGGTEFMAAVGDQVWTTEATRTITGNVTVGGYDAAADFNATQDASIKTQTDLALDDYDPPTNGEMIARTLAAADYFDYTTDTANAVHPEGTSGTLPTATHTATTIAVPEATITQNDQYKHGIFMVTSGNCDKAWGRITASAEAATDTVTVSGLDVTNCTVDSDLDGATFRIGPPTGIPDDILEADANDRIAAKVEEMDANVISDTQLSYCGTGIQFTVQNDAANSATQVATNLTDANYADDQFGGTTVPKRAVVFMTGNVKGRAATIQSFDTTGGAAEDLLGFTSIGVEPDSGVIGCIF